MIPCIEKALDKTWYQSASLGVAAGLATTLILVLNQFTAPAIAMRFAEDQMMALDMVMPNEHYQNDILASQQEIVLEGTSYVMYTARSENGTTSGYVVQTEGKGYAGAIKILVGMDANLTLLGVRVLSHAETPGLGDKIEINKNDWITSFDGRSLDNTSTTEWAVKKDGGVFDQFSGATITPRAVVNAVHQSLVDIEAAVRKGQLEEKES